MHTLCHWRKSLLINVLHIPNGTPCAQSNTWPGLLAGDSTTQRCFGLTCLRFPCSPSDQGSAYTSLSRISSQAPAPVSSLRKEEVQRQPSERWAATSTPRPAIR